VAIEPRTAPAPLAEQFGFGTYYECQLKLEGTATPVLVYTRRVPELWRKGLPSEQRGFAWGLFLKLGSNDPALPTPMFVAPRLEWRCDGLLGDLGMDFGLLASLRSNRPLVSQEQEAFYAMMAAVARAAPGELSKQADAELRRSGRRAESVVPLFNQPDAQAGRLVVLEGTARSVVDVPVDDPAVAARYGISHYYQITLFTFGTPDEPDADSQGNPLVVCVERLPLGMPVGDDPKFSEPVRVAGFFLKKWAYPIAQPGGKTVLQLAPLVIGQEPVWQRAAAGAPAGIAGASAAVLLVAGVVLVVWLAARPKSAVALHSNYRG
jgi:hypothetical protein